MTDEQDVTLVDVNIEQATSPRYMSSTPRPCVKKDHVRRFIVLVIWPLCACIFFDMMFLLFKDGLLLSVYLTVRLIWEAVIIIIVFLADRDQLQLELLRGPWFKSN